MTHKQIDEMEDGTNMDRLIAEKLFGIDMNPVFYKGEPEGELYPGRICYAYDTWVRPRADSYSTDIIEALEVLSVIRARGQPSNYIADLTLQWNDRDNGWTVGWLINGHGDTIWDPCAFAKTLPHAICRFALKIIYP